MKPETRNAKPALILLSLLTVAGGLGCGYLYFALSDLMILALLVMVIALALGIAAPRFPWLWTLLLTASAPAAALFHPANYARLQTARLESALLAALLSAIMGAFAGAWLRRMATRAFSR